MSRTLSWQSEDSSKTRVLQVAVRVARGETRLVVVERYGNLAGGLFGGLIGGVGGGVGFGVGMGVGIGALGSALFATVFPIVALTGSYLIARTAFRSTVQGRMRVLARLMDDMVAVVEDATEEGGRLPPGEG
jgi:predicted lipid-binding transport protein (Tim44 family)